MAFIQVPCGCLCVLFLNFNVHVLSKIIFSKGEQFFFKVFDEYSKLFLYYLNNLRTRNILFIKCYYWLYFFIKLWLKQWKKAVRVSRKWINQRRSKTIIHTKFQLLILFITRVISINLASDKFNTMCGKCIVVSLLYY